MSSLWGISLRALGLSGLRNLQFDFLVGKQLGSLEMAINPSPQKPKQEVSLEKQEVLVHNMA